jgi:hypothetical protein
VSIAYKSAGAGNGTETNAASLDLACPASVDANDILVGHVTYEGLSAAPTTPSGWSFLYGPANVGDATAVGRAWVYGKLADGSEDGATIGFGTAGGTSGRYGRIYSFSGWVSGAIEDLFSSWIDDPSEGSIPLPPVQTQSTGALAVALLVQDDNNSFAAAGAVTGGTWAEPVAEFVSTTLGAQGCCVGIQTSTPTGNPGHISGGTANATADEGSSIGFSLHDTAQTVISFTTYHDVTDTPKTVNIPGCDSSGLNGLPDRLLVLAGGNKTGSANAPSDCTTTTTVGTTSAWSEILEGLNNSATSCWFSSASATVSAAGDTTVSVSRTQPATVQPWGFTVFRLRGYGDIGVSSSQGDGATEVLSLTVAEDSFVAFGGYDWDPALPTGYDPSSGAMQVIRTQIATTYTATVAWWEGQAAGTRNYGTTGSATGSYSTVAIEVEAGSTVTDLVVADATQAQSTDSIALTQVHVLVVNDAAQAQAADNVAIRVNLVVADAVQAQSTDAIALTQTHVLTVADAAQAQSTDGIALTQVHVLTVADAAQAQSTDGIALTQVHVLTVADAAQAQTADNVVLDVATTLVVNDAAQAQSTDAIALTQVHVLTVADATQAQSTDAITLTVGGTTLTVNDAAQAQSTDAVTLTQVHVLTVADAAQAQSTDAVALTQVHSLVVADAAQAQSADALVLTQVHVLTVADATHVQSVGSPTLTQVHVLTVADAMQGQTADNVVLVDLSLGMIGEAYSYQPRSVGGAVSSGTGMVGAIT